MLVNHVGDKAKSLEKLSTIKCYNCGKQIALDMKNVKKRLAIVKEDSEELLVTTVVCRNCGKLRYVQLDSKKTIELYEEVVKFLRKKYLSTKGGKKWKRKDGEKLLRLNKELDKERKALMMKYDGKEMRYKYECYDVLRNGDFVFTVSK